eukprot:CAMPEP_0170069468 /NCGR_PEP_ID=MMETSP0019_2-20121128/8134_1 /TAXON_ID=98059 /ORGANISM="Dinobryon sp., Strain UTEXLB2267" /LENGTH=69 /DNA_ID=CAMNT_0010277525 /DNA_START=725 /DNA_END=934 /DNA_ORIENTATION=+
MASSFLTRYVSMTNSSTSAALAMVAMMAAATFFCGLIFGVDFLRRMDSFGSENYARHRENEKDSRSSTY